MASRQHTIELNGQKYDAVTGKIIAPATTAKSTIAAAVKHPAPSPKKPVVASSPKHIDGFAKRPKVAKPQQPRNHPSPNLALHQKPAKSQTLMRAAVKQPVSTKIHSQIVSKHNPVNPIPTNASMSSFVSGIQPGRALRASHVAKSNLISRFGNGSPNIQTAHIAVKPAPKATKSSATHKSNPAPIVSAVEPRAHLPSATQTNQFHSAIENASGHSQPRAKKQRYHHKVAHKLHVSPRLVSFVSVTILTLGISGFFAYQNLPELSMRVASTRAGLDANLPAYQPAGFKISGPIKYQPGAVTVTYKSNTDERNFNVTQKNSSWNSETLLGSFVSPTKEPYQTFQAKGRTIYMYSGDKATWVDGGIWYTVDGKANLNSDQLLKIAESL